MFHLKKEKNIFTKTFAGRPLLLLKKLKII